MEKQLVLFKDIPFVDEVEEETVGETIKPQAVETQDVSETRKHEQRVTGVVRKCVQRKRGAQKRTTQRALFVRCGSPCMCHRTLPTMAGNVKF